jgi:SAM-dependent methyltransferase
MSACSQCRRADAATTKREPVATRDDGRVTESMAAVWHTNAERWIVWARTAGHDSYWRFHRDRFLTLVPAPGRLTVDIGCGEGRVGRDLVGAGHRVVGVDSSPTMVRACVTHPDGHPAGVGDASHLPLRDGAADLAVAFMALHDVDDLAGAIAEAARILVVGGRLHLAIVHPVNSAGAFEGRDAAAPFVIEGSYTSSFRYADVAERDGLRMTFHGWHRPLAAYTTALGNAGFVIEALDEVADPEPADRWTRVPLFLHLIARLERAARPA